MESRSGLRDLWSTSGPDRTAAFSDAVLAIAMTILVLDLKAPEVAGRREYDAAVLAALPRPRFRPRGGRFGDVTWARIAPGGLARIGLRRIPSRWTRTARGGADRVALSSHYASRARLAPARAGPKVDGVLVVEAGVGVMT